MAKYLTEANKRALLAFLSSRAAAGEGSLKTWGRMQKPPILAHQAEDLADILVSEGKATVEERASGRVWILVKSAPEEESKEEACDDDDEVEDDEDCDDDDNEAEEDEDQDDEANDDEDCDAVAEGELAAARVRIGELIDEVEQLRERTAGLEARLRVSASQPAPTPARGEEPCHGCAELRSERDALCTELLQARATSSDIMAEAAESMGLDSETEWSLVIDQIRSLKMVVAQARPTIDGGTLASYLTGLTDDQWLTVQRGRAQLAEARDLRAKAAALEADGTRILEGLLDTPAAQAPAEPPPPPVEAPPPPAPSGEAVREEGPTPPPSEEGPRLPPAGTLQYDVLQLVIKRGKGDAQTLATKLNEEKQRVSSALALLTKRGILVRVAVGLYEPAPALRRVA